jgi:hypothetical protein
MVIGLTRHLDVVEETREWPLADGTITVTDSAGARLADATTFGFLLALAPDAARPEKGTLDLTLPLDAMDGPGLDRVLAAAPFPLLSFYGTVTGAAPDLTATGSLDLAGVTSEATFAVTVTETGARVTGSAPFPGAPDLSLVVDATTLAN